MKYKHKTAIILALHRLSGCVLSLMVVASSQNSLSAQTAVSASGGNGSGSGGNVSYTIGQVMYTNISGEGGNISLGVQQPNLYLNVGTEDPEITLSASLFPNPANSSTSLKLEGQNELTIADDLAYNLFDLNGKLLLSQPIQAAVTSIPVDQLTNGVYVLQVTRKNIEIRSFKVFKTN